MKLKKLLLLSVLIMLSSGMAYAQDNDKKEQKDEKLTYYLMIGEAQPEIWKAIVEGGGKDLTKPGREATEALGGKIIGYYLGATEAKNYIIAAYPSSTDMSKIVYMRAAQGVMKNLKFIEIIPADDVHNIFEGIKLK